MEEEEYVHINEDGTTEIRTREPANKKSSSKSNLAKENFAGGR